MKLAALIAAMVALFLSGLVNYALAHSWYSSTKDPGTGFSCCGGNDCDRIGAESVKPDGQGGYTYLPTGEHIPASRVQQSRDFEFHRCIYLQSFTNQNTGLSYRQGDTRCFFAPPGSV